MSEKIVRCKNKSCGNFDEDRKDQCCYILPDKCDDIEQETVFILTEKGYETLHKNQEKTFELLTGSEFNKQPTQEKIDILFDNFAEFLKEKNRRYGDSALTPVQIFSKSGAGSQICNRLDDKLSRIQNSEELKKNDLADSFGYHALLLIEKGWFDFNELLD